MTISIKSAAAFVSGVALLFVTAAFIPGDSHAVDAPRCVFNTIVQPENNGGTTLSWRVYDATTINLSDVGSVDKADSLVVFPNVVTTYTITATGPGGTTDCSVVAHPVSSYPFIGNTGIFGNFATPSQECVINIEPDFVVPGGTGVLSWNAAGAVKAFLNNGIGNVGKSGSRVVPGGPVPVTYTLTAEYTNGTIRTCDATVLPAVGVAGTQIPGAFVPQTPSVAPHVQLQTPLTAPQIGAPSVTIVPTLQPAPTHVSLNAVPYTGPEDVLYVLAMLLIALSAGITLFQNRRIVLG